MRGGSVVHSESTMQFFYGPEGTISFVVIGAEKVSFSHSNDQSHHTTTTTEFNISTVT